MLMLEAEINMAPSIQRQHRSISTWLNSSSPTALRLDRLTLLYLIFAIVSSSATLAKAADEAVFGA
jgi:hypothetical protein